MDQLIEEISTQLEAIVAISPTITTPTTTMSELRTPSRNDHARAPPIAVTIATTTNTTATTMTSATIFDMMIPALSRQCVTKPPSTPSSSGSGMDMCGVCLSPLKSCSSIVETRCKHKFHDKCLLKVKERKAECPSCRHPLTPLTAAESTELLGFSLDESPIPSRRPPPRELQRWLPSQTTFHQPTSSRSADIVLAATRGRNAVRMAMLRREHDQRHTAATAMWSPSQRPEE